MSKKGKGKKGPKNRDKTYSYKKNSSMYYLYSEREKFKSKIKFI